MIGSSNERGNSIAIFKTLVVGFLWTAEVVLERCGRNGLDPTPIPNTHVSQRWCLGKRPLDGHKPATKPFSDHRLPSDLNFRYPVYWVNHHSGIYCIGEPCPIQIILSFDQIFVLFFRLKKTLAVDCSFCSIFPNAAEANSFPQKHPAIERTIFDRTRSGITVIYAQSTRVTFVDCPDQGDHKLFVLFIFDMRI